MFAKYIALQIKMVYIENKQTFEQTRTEGIHMMKNDKEEYKGKIIELVNSIKEESVLRRIYLMIITMIGADH